MVNSDQSSVIRGSSGEPAAGGTIFEGVLNETHSSVQQNESEMSRMRDEFASDRTLRVCAKINWYFRSLLYHGLFALSFRSDLVALSEKSAGIASYFESRALSETGSRMGTTKWPIFDRKAAKYGLKMRWTMLSLFLYSA